MGHMGCARGYVTGFVGVTGDQKAALDAATSLDATHPVAAETDTRFPTADQKAALNAANSPDGTNAFATMDDLP